MIPFWVLRHSGESFPLSKVAEIACCYYDIHRDDARYEALLEELRYQDRILWRQSMLQMLEGGLAALDHPLRYLSRIQDDVYLAQCCERLERGDFMVITLARSLTTSVPSVLRSGWKHCGAVIML